ncbi:diguanylate cyclase domain-containing protein [Cohaesibacter intestini]|uniref:diguanylate cyclase domain-containing protein n=1 Tax=Cohaesibacter intestini TaxID=2211145 RepID=UPI000DEBE5E9|nr:diguanylate cyclase [Cohaesibacter intestini]
MFRRSLNILIAMPDRAVESMLEAVPSHDRFSHAFTTQASALDAGLSRFSIIILDLSYQSPANLRLIDQQRDPSTLMVACCSGSDFNSFAPHLHRFDAIWPKPLDAEQIQESFASLLQRIKQREEAQLNKTYLDTLIDSLPELIWFKDARGAHLKVNESFCRTVGKSKAQIEGRGHYYIWDIEPDEYADGEYICLESEEIVLEKKETCLFDETVKCSGEMRKFKTYKSPVFDTDGSVIGTVGFAHDATDLQNLMVELNILLEGLPFAVMVTDKHRVITNVNQKFVDIFAHNRDDMIGSSVIDLFEITKNNDGQREWTLNEEDGQILLQAKDKIFKLHDEKLMDVFGNCTGQIYLFLDITHEHRERTRLQVDANTDFLTKLNNRRCLQTYLQEKPIASDTALILVDLDNFKEVNDRFGHDEGDRVLIAFARLLKQMYPSEHIFRLGGDEFAILLPSISDPNALNACVAQLLAAFDRHIAQNFVHTNIAASVGVGTAALSAHTFADLFKKADSSLYQVKRSKKAA